MPEVIHYAHDELSHWDSWQAYALAEMEKNGDVSPALKLAARRLQWLLKMNPEGAERVMKEWKRLGFTPPWAPYRRPDQVPQGTAQKSLAASSGIASQ
jgi:hypothetical protein